MTKKEEILTEILDAQRLFYDVQRTEYLKLCAVEQKILDDCDRKLNEIRRQKACFFNYTPINDAAKQLYEKVIELEKLAGINRC